MIPHISERSLEDNCKAIPQNNAYKIIHLVFIKKQIGQVMKQGFSLSYDMIKALDEEIEAKAMEENIVPGRKVCLSFYYPLPK